MGAPGEPLSPTQDGAGYVFTRSGTTWTEEARLLSKLPPAVTSNNGNFGAAAAVAGDVVAFSDPNEDWLGVADDVGAVYVFTRSASTWSLSQRIEPSVWQEILMFGQALDLSGSRMLIGAPGEGWFECTGAAYVYELVGSKFVEDARLEDPITNPNCNFFGYEVHQDGDTALVNSENSIQVFDRGPGGWSHAEECARSQRRRDRPRAPPSRTWPRPCARPPTRRGPPPGSRP